LSGQDNEIQRPRVLVVDGDRSFLDRMTDILKEGGFQPHAVRTGDGARTALKEDLFDVVITDVMVGDTPGVDLLRHVKARDRFLPVICISSERSFDNAVEMLRAGAADFLSKPVPDRQVIAAVSRACIDRQYALEKEQIVARSDTWARELLALRQLGEASSKEMLQALFKRAIEAVSDTLQVETSSLMLTEGDALRVVEAIGLPSEVIGKATVPLGKGISGHVARTGKPLLINDISQHEKFGPSSFKKQYSTQSALCVPLMRGDRVLGVMNANNKKNGEAFQESDRDLLVTMAAQVAMSIDNARLYAGLEEKAEDLRKAHEELVRLDRDKTELILNISHELKTPLTTIIGFASLIPSLDLKGETDNLMEFVAHLESSATHLNYLVERILELFRLEAGRIPLRLEKHPVGDVVGAALQELENTLDGRVVTWEPSKIHSVTVSCDTRLFTRALGLVLENAVKFSPDGSPLELTVHSHERLPDVPDYAAGPEIWSGSRDQGGYVRIVIRDHGVGMREKDIPRIFEKFKQLGDIMTEKPSGIGLGLSIARAILERHSGAIWADPAPGGGTRLHLLIPAA
jgi:signal transduction histidine kinase/DNA-binding response OmpR family regulator